MTSSYLDCKPLSSGNIEYYFTNLKKLGEGSYGVVYSANSSENALSIIGPDLPNTVAIKLMSIDQKHLEELRNEIQIMKTINIPRTLKYYGCFVDEYKSVYLITELAPGQDLFELIANDKLTTLHKNDIAAQLAQAIHDMHAAGLIHRDIKPENIIYDMDTKRLTVIDYGMSCIHASRLGNCTHNTGTLAYFDYHLVPGNVNSMKHADWWSFGQTIIPLYTSMLLWDEVNNTYFPLDRTYLMHIPIQYHDILGLLTNPKIPQYMRPSPDKILEIFSGHGHAHLVSAPKYNTVHKSNYKMGSV